MTATKEAKKKSAKKADPKPAKIAVAEEKEAPKLINYEPKGEVAQIIRDFGTDKLSLNAKAASIIGQNFFVNLKQEKFSAQDAVNMVLEQTNVDMSGCYPKSSYSESPLHRGFHAISKAETNETLDDKDGKKIDREARGVRGFIFKEGKIGLKKGGFYFPNPKMKYNRIEPADLKLACETLVSNIVERRRTS